MRVFSFIITVALVALVSSCSCNRNAKKEQTNSSTQLIKNDRYHFSFELPQTWTVKENSDNGDGYFIQSGYPEIDIRVYAQLIIPNGEDDECKRTQLFKFDDDTQGTQCFYSDSEYFIYRYSAKIQLAFYISANKDWIEKNQTTLDNIARSMKFIEDKGNF